MPRFPDMPSFRVPVSGGEIEQAMAALDQEAGIETTEELLYAYGGEGGEIGEARIVIVEAESADEAKRRVQDILPNHIVRDAELIPES
jgi:hypothetical protein